MFREIWKQEGEVAASLKLAAAPKREADFARLFTTENWCHRNGKTKVELTCPATAIDELGSLIDDDLLAHQSPRKRLGAVDGRCATPRLRAWSDLSAYGKRRRKMHSLGWNEKSQRYQTPKLF